VAGQSLNALRDLLCRWSAEPEDHLDALAVSYPDRTSEQTVDCLLGLLAVSHESQQQQTAARVLDALALSLPRLASPDRRRVAEALQEAAPLIAAGAWAPMLRAAGERISGVVMELGWPAAAEALRAGFRG